MTADSAQRDSVGKVHALGLNWTWVGTPTPAMAVVIVLDPDVDDELTNTVELAVEMIDGDGQPVTLGPAGEPLRVQIQATADEPASRLMLAFSVGPGIPLEPGRYSWRAVDSDDKEYSRVGFDVRPPG